MIVVIMGDLVGIGLEIIIKFFVEGVLSGVLVVVVGCVQMLWWILVLNIMLWVELCIIDYFVEVSFFLVIINVIDELFSDLQGLCSGEVQVQVGDFVFCCIRWVIVLVLEGVVVVIVIVLLNKEVLYFVGYVYFGYIELLVYLMQIIDYVMVFYIEKFKVIYIIIYIFLCQFFDIFNQLWIEMVIGVVDCFLCCVGYLCLCIVVVGVNLYVGENGLFGDEEICIVVLVVVVMWVKGVEVIGFCLLDMVFMQCYEGMYDMVVVMYYDQGYILLKLLGFYDGVNIIVGLLFICIFVDYGIVFDIVWIGKVKFESMVIFIEFVMYIVQE